MFIFFLFHFKIESENLFSHNINVYLLNIIIYESPYILTIDR